jgi:hypothetical protein
MTKSGNMIRVLERGSGRTLRIRRVLVEEALPETKIMRSRYGMNSMNFSTSSKGVLISRGRQRALQVLKMRLKDLIIKLMLRLNSWMLSKVSKL